MDTEIPQIKIPENGEITPSELKKETDSKFKDINYTLLGVVVILLVMVATLIIDSFHINSAIYKEYSEKIQTLDTIQKSNEALLEEIKNNQEIILKLLEQFKNLNNK